MGEAIIVGRGTGEHSSGDYLITQVFNENAIWVVPKLSNQKFSVRIFGGGGGAGWYASYNCGGGGGGGYMNNAILELTPGEEIAITIGTGGQGNGSGAFSSIGGTGGTTSFGSYLSANGGSGGKTIRLGTNSATYYNGGYGGYGGSGGGSISHISYAYLTISDSVLNDFKYSGTGFQFGGGGGNVIGNGGYWGGGGGGYTAINISYSGGVGGQIYDNIGDLNSLNSTSGLGGNGNSSIRRGQYSFINTIATNGVNTIGLGLEFEGIGASGSANYQGGGGYGGSGGNNGGGGGGYGGNGGSYFGGGGGYGADGGNGNPASLSSVGGGGGYGKYGKGGGYGSAKGGIAAGGGVSSGSVGSGGGGICIIQYYI